ncbi:MAG: DNA-binding protein [Burkholderiales bacterium]
MASTKQRGGIRETDVWEAADALLLEGARPTIERIRQKAGRGSPNTVGPYLDTWFKGLGARIRDPGAFAAAPAIPDPITQAASHFWEAALSVARGEAAAALAAERESLDSAAADLEKQRRTLTVERVELQTRLEAQDQAMELLRAQLDERRDQRDLLQRTLEDRNLAYAAAEQRLTALIGEIDALRKVLDQERGRFEAERRALDERAATHEKRWLHEVDRAREALKTAEARAARAASEQLQRFEALQHDLQGVAAHRSRLIERATAQDLELVRLRSEHETAISMANDVRAQLGRREAEAETQTARLQEQLAMALQQLAEKEREHGAVVRSLTNKTLRSEKVKAARRVR